MATNSIELSVVHFDLQNMQPRDLTNDFGPSATAGFFGRFVRDIPGISRGTNSATLGYCTNMKLVHIQHNGF